MRVCVCAYTAGEPPKVCRAGEPPSRPRAFPWVRGKLPGGWRSSCLPCSSLAGVGERGAGGFGEAFPKAAAQVSPEELLEAHRSSLAMDVLNPLLPVKLFHLLAGRKI